MTHSIINVEEDEDEDEEGEEDEQEEVVDEQVGKSCGYQHMACVAKEQTGEGVAAASGDSPTPSTWRVGVTTTTGSPLKSVPTPSPADSDYPLSVQSCSDKTSSTSHVSSVPSYLLASIIAYLALSRCFYRTIIVVKTCATCAKSSSQ